MTVAQFFYAFFMASGLILIVITVHIRIGSLEAEVERLRRKVEGEQWYGWTPAKKARMRAAIEQDGEVDHGH
jgi:hypothetical protein